MHRTKINIEAKVRVNSGVHSRVAREFIAVALRSIRGRIDTRTISQ